MFFLICGYLVVDYICVFYDIFLFCENFWIISCNDIVEWYNLINFYGEKSKILDYVIIIFEFKVFLYICNFFVNENKIGIKKCYNLWCIFVNFMNIERICNVILDFIFKIEMCWEI